MVFHILVEDALDLRVALKSRDLRDLSEHCLDSLATFGIDALRSDTATLHFEPKRLRTQVYPWQTVRA